MIYYSGEFVHNQKIYWAGQIIATSHDLTPKGSVLEGKSPYFREMEVGELLKFGQIRD